MSALKVTVHAIFRGLLLSLFVFGARFAAGQEDAAPGQPALDAVPAAATDTLSDEQNQVADKYRRLEDLIFKMADFESTSNPRRAALLKQAYKQSKDRLTQSQLSAIVALLSQKQYKRALDGQEVARKDLQELLQLLLSEDRSDRLKTETQRMKDHIKELQRLQRLQRGVRGQTEGGADAKELAEKQSKVADRTGELAKQLEDSTPPGDQTQPDKPGEQAPGSPQPGAEPGDAKPAPQDAPQPSPDAPSAPSEPGQGETEEQTPQAPPPAPDDQSTAKKRVREAEQKMREAQQRLEEAKRSESLEKQTEALQKLQEAIAELEEVLRQLRDEEMERVLALLEGRFRQMLEEEIKVYEATQRLDQTPEDQRGRALDIRAGKLAFDQRKIAGQADRCLTLLLEEGSSIAFPEVVQQIRDDMESVSERLAETKIGTITQDMEQEIIDSLEEMIAAFQKAQQDMEKPRSGQPSQPGENGEQPLVDALAELKMIRSLQMRVNLRTQRYAKLLDNVEDPVGQAATEDLRRALGELGEREARIQQITRDIVLGKNR
jgi:hypothetical protein